MIAVLAGGVGAARLLEGLVQVVEPETVTVVVNTGDDLVIHGLHVSPDLDTITYTLSGQSNRETGWGLAGETWQVMDGLDRYGVATWFRLGDRDLATHLYRTNRLREGVPLSAVTAEHSRSWGLGLKLLPMTDDTVATRLQLSDGEEIDFQEYFVHLRHEVAVAGVRYEGATTALPAPGVCEALESSEVILIAPSNPILSIGPVLALGPVAEILRRRRNDVVAVSPIVGGTALKGPADRLLVELGGEATPVGVAHHLAPFAGHLVLDEVDAALARGVAAAGMSPLVTDTVMTDSRRAAALARVCLGIARGERTPSPDSLLR